MKPKLKLPVPPGKSLYPFQKSDAKFFVKTLKNHGGGFCMNEQGTGKTVIATVVANTLKALGHVDKVLIVCPAIMRHTWFEEFMDWSTQDWTVQAIDQNTPFDSRKRRLPDKDVNVLIVSYKYIIEKRILKWLTEKYGFDMLICDEWHYCKNLKMGRRGSKTKHQRTNRTRAGLYLMQNAPYKLALTGTPYTKNVMDFYPQLIPFADTKDIGESYTEFGYTFSRLVDNGFGRYFEGLRNEELLKSIYKPFSRRRLLEDVVEDMPSISYRRLYVDVPKTLAKKSLRYVDAAVAEVMGENYAYRDTDDKDFVATMRRELGVAKCKGIVEHILHALDSYSPIVVYVYHTQVIEILQKALAKKKIKTASIYGKTTSQQKQTHIKKFQKGKIPVLLLQIKSAIGITLTKANYGIAAEIDWSFASMDQAFKRIHRISQDTHCQIDWILAKNSIDKHIVSAINKKRREAKRIMGD